MSMGEYTVTDDIQINKTTIKPGESFEISYVDPRHAAADWKLLNSTGEVVKEASNTTVFTVSEGIEEIGGYDLQVICDGETTTYDGSEQIVTTQSGLPTAVLTKLNDAEDGTLVNEVIPDTTNGNYYVVRLVSKDYETIKDDVAEALQDNTSLTNDAMVYYLKKYNFTVYDVDIFNALRESNPEYLVQRPDLAEEADDTTATN